MSKMEQVGMSYERFKELYDKNNGFNEGMPACSLGHTENYIESIKSGAKRLNEEESEFVESIILS